MESKILQFFLEALVEMIDGSNAAAEDGDRGRGNKALCLVIWDDGSGRFGTVSDNPAGLNEWLVFDTSDHLATYLQDWVNPGSDMQEFINEQLERLATDVMARATHIRGQFCSRGNAEIEKSLNWLVKFGRMKAVGDGWFEWIEKQEK